jgi:hypothetical protein
VTDEVKKGTFHNAERWEGALPFTQDELLELA